MKSGKKFKQKDLEEKPEEMAKEIARILGAKHVE